MRSRHNISTRKLLQKSTHFLPNTVQGFHPNHLDDICDEITSGRVELCDDNFLTQNNTRKQFRQIYDTMQMLRKHQY